MTGSAEIEPMSAPAPLHCAICAIYAAHTICAAHAAHATRAHATRAYATRAPRPLA